MGSGPRSAGAIHAFGRLYIVLYVVLRYYFSSGLTNWMFSTSTKSGSQFTAYGRGIHTTL